MCFSLLIILLCNGFYYIPFPTYVHVTSLFIDPIFNLFLLSTYYCCVPIPTFFIHCTISYFVPIPTLYLFLHCTYSYIVPIPTLNLFLHCTYSYIVPIPILSCLHSFFVRLRSLIMMVIFIPIFSLKKYNKNNKTKFFFFLISTIFGNNVRIFTSYIEVLQGRI